MKVLRTRILETTRGDGSKFYFLQERWVDALRRRFEPPDDTSWVHVGSFLDFSEAQKAKATHEKCKVVDAKVVG